MYKLTLLLDNKKYDLLIPKDQDILSLAIEKNLDPPFSCENGTCGLCKAKLLKGDVHMLKDDALNDDDFDNQCILTCQASLKKDSIISYDDVSKE